MNLTALRADAERLNAAALDAAANLRRIAMERGWDSYDAAVAWKYLQFAEGAATAATNRYLEAQMAENAMRRTFNPEPVRNRFVA